MRRAPVRLLSIASGLIAGLLIAEIVLRLMGFTYLNLYSVDPDVGFTLRPGAEGWWRNEGTTYVKINSDGLRDREHAKLKPPGTFRIAVLGDSFTEALEVPLEDAFWAVAERRLQGCEAFGGRNVEVINFGVSGFSTARELITLRRRVWQYSPDVIVLNLTTGNDIKDNSRLLNREYGSLPLPYFVYKEGKLALDNSLLDERNRSVTFRLQTSLPGSSFNWLRNHLRLIGLTDKARTALTIYRQRRDAPTRVGDEPGIDNKIYSEPTDPAWEEAWRVTEGMLLEMRDEVKARGAKFLLVTGSSGIQIYPDPAVRRDYARRLGVADLFYPDRRMKALGEHEGIEVLNLAPALLSYAEQNRIVLHGAGGFGHWNVAGHHAVGDLVADKLCEMASTANE